MLRPVLALLVALDLAACASLPPPPAPMALPARFQEAAGAEALWVPGSPAAAAAVPERWWSLFGDPGLDALASRLLVDNQNLQAAAAQVALAQAALQSAAAAGTPTLGLQAGATRDGTPAGARGRSTASSYGFTAQAGWELDLWGRLQQDQQAAQARAEASAADLAAARLSATATLVQTYFALRTAEAQAALLARTEAADARVLQLTQARQAAGVVAESDVLQARTQLGSVRAQREEAELQRRQLGHALAVLVGRTPAEVEIGPSAGLPVLPAVPAAPALLPSTLLQRRPDIRAAQARVAAAWRGLGAAEAAFFPSLSLSASAGFKSAGVARLLGAPNLAWALGGALAQTVFDGGARVAARGSARASADLATAQYRQTVLVAVQEVEDNLAAVQALAQEAGWQQAALDAAQRNLALTQARYGAGTVAFVELASAQAAALSAEGTLLQLQQRRLAAVATLLKNLAGGWA